MADEGRIHYSLNLKLYRQEKFFGPGLALLLELVETTNSLRMATAQMNMAYSKAWKMIRVAEENLGYPLLETKTGGKGGGGAILTPRAQKLLKAYNDFEQAVYTEANELWLKFFEEIQENERSWENEKPVKPDQEESKPLVAAVLMASGFSRRMGCNKLLLNMGSQTVIWYVMEQINRIGFDEKIVVSQYDQIISLAQDLDFATAFNPWAEQGKSSSIRIALEALPAMNGYCFFTGDQILLRDDLLKGLLAAFRQHPDKIVVPTYKGEWGSPAIFPGDLKTELLRLSGEQGGRKVAERYRERVMLVEADPAWQGMDFDTTDQWIYVQSLKEEMK